jgi:hypothetical protein
MSKRFDRVIVYLNLLFTTMNIILYGSNIVNLTIGSLGVIASTIFALIAYVEAQDE